MIGTSAARMLTVLCALFSGVHIIVGLLSLDKLSSAWPALAAMMLYLLATVVVLSPGPEKLPIWRALAGVGTVISMAALVDSVLPKVIWPGYAAWHTAASYTLLVVINLRGRVFLSWVGGVLSVVLTVIWASSAASGWIGGVLMSIATIGWLTVATGVSHFLRNNNRLITQYAADARASVDRYVSEKALGVARTEWMDHIRRVAAPALEQICAHQHFPSEVQRQEYTLIEAQLRDEVRGRSLATDTVLEAARRARRRGVTVHLIDDRKEGLSPSLVTRAAEKVIAVLDQAQTGTVTVRIKPAGGSSAVTIFASASENSDEPTLVEIV
jgi:hypothetical protein